MDPGSRLIICTGQPSWAYIDTEDPEPAFTNFSYLASLADLAKKDHRLCAVLSGDSHHYSRYVEGECQYITAGGGGAFLHPTHQLKEKKFEWAYPAPGVKPVPGQNKYPREFLPGIPRGPARRAFTPIRRRRVASCPATALRRSAGVRGDAPLPASSSPDASHAGRSPRPVASGAGVSRLHGNALHLSSLLCLAMAGRLGGTARWPSGGFSSPWRFIVGLLHATVQAVAVMLATCLLALWLAGIPNGCSSRSASWAACSATISASTCWCRSTIRQLNKPSRRPHRGLQMLPAPAHPARRRAQDLPGRPHQGAG
jgi:hypothetical protein